MIRSFYAKYHSTNGKTLIGGVLKSQTSCFQSRAEAQQRLDGTIQINGDHCQGEVVGSARPPEIFLHCGTGPSQSLGGQCFRCHKVLTEQDATMANDPELNEWTIEECQKVLDSVLGIDCNTIKLADDDLNGWRAYTATRIQEAREKEHDDLETIRRVAEWVKGRFVVHVLPEAGSRVHIIPINEDGTVKICRRDAQQEMIIEVIRDSDKEVHLCRECEIRKLSTDTR